jgi:hypothetical protein
LNTVTRAEFGLQIGRRLHIFPLSKVDDQITNKCKVNYL